MTYRVLAVAVLLAGVMQPMGAEQNYRLDLTWGGYGTGNGQFGADISGFAIRGDRIVVTDPRNSRIQMFDLNGRFLSKFGTLGSGRDNLNWPIDVDFDATGSLYIADRGNARIQKRTSSYALVTLIGQPAGSPEYFTNLQAIAVDQPHRRLWSLNGGPAPRLACWTLQGQFITSFLPVHLWPPMDLAVGGDGNLYVCDGYRVVVYSPEGLELRWIDSSLGLRFDTPFGLAFDAFDRLYVADYGASRIFKMTDDGTGICSWLAREDVTFAEVTEVAVDHQQRVYVSDGSVIKRFCLNRRPSR